MQKNKIEKHRISTFEDCKDIISGSVIFVVAIVMLAASFSIRAHELAGAINARFMPRIISVAMAFCSLIVVVQGIISLHHKQNLEKDGEHSKKAEIEIKPFAVTLVLLILYAMLFRTLGFILSSILYLMGQITVLTLKENQTRKNLICTCITAVVVPVVVYIIFRYGLKILLPVGLIG